MFCVGALLCAVAMHYDWSGWLIFVGALGVGWALNEEERRVAEREAVYK
jgi:hypothetical protein